MTLPTGLFDEIKSYLDITWHDTATDEKLNGIIARGISFLNRKAGAELNFENEDSPKELLFEYCKYARNGLLNEFMVNYAPFLQDLRATNGGAYG